MLDKQRKEQIRKYQKSPGYSLGGRAGYGGGFDYNGRDVHGKIWYTHTRGGITYQSGIRRFWCWWWNEWCFS